MPKTHKIAGLMGVFFWVLAPGVDSAWADDHRIFPTSSLFLSARPGPAEGSGRLKPPAGAGPLLSPSFRENSGAPGLKYDLSFSQAFNLSLAASQWRQDGQPGAGSPGPAPALNGLGNQEDLRDLGKFEIWAFSVGLDWAGEKGHGLRLGFLYGADPKTGWTGRLDQTKSLDRPPQALDVGYVFSLDNLYLRLGCVYSLTEQTQKSNLGLIRNAKPDPTFYLRLQLRF